MTLLVWLHSGDSISASAGRWPYQYIGQASKSDSSSINSMRQAVYNDTGHGILFQNFAVSGSRLAAATGSTSAETVGSTYIDPVLAQKSIVSFSASGTSRLTSRKYLYTCAIGSNDGALGGYANATLYANAVATVANARRTAGADLIGLCTLLPRADGTMLEANRLAYNAKLTDSAWRLSNGIDYVIDLASEATMGDPNNLPANNGGVTTYYNADNIHPQDAGSALLATNVVTSALATILAAI